ncbi:MAG: long-chain fatty acid--CoA ligase [bacterium]|nr:long-chain fatty acid--CoA ligase [bacterium]
MNEAQKKWYIEQLTAPAMMNRNVTRLGHRPFQSWKTSPDTTTTLTYAEAWRIIKELAAGLIDIGLKPGDRGAVMCHTCPEWVWADYSILSSAGITVCIYPTLSKSEMTYIVNDSGVKVIYLKDETNLQKVLDSWDKMPNLEKVIVLKDGFDHFDDRVMNITDLRALGVALLARDRFVVERTWRSIELTDNMTIVYTSGTTGMPKGVVHTHLSYNTAICRDLKIAPEYREGDILLSFLPLSHTYERQCGHGAAIMAGVTIAYTNPKTLVGDLQLFKPHIFMSVPRIYERVYLAMKEMASQSPVKRKIFDAAMRTGIKLIEARADEHGFVDMHEDADLTEGINPWLSFKYKLFDKLVFSKVRERFGGRMRAVFSAAGSLPADLCKVFMAMGFVILEGYGLTETWNTINLNRPGKILPGSVGPPATGVEGRIAEDGEWQVRGENIFCEYWNKPEDTAEAFTEDGFFKTGDIVQEVADGYIKIIDRKKGIMVLDTGKNVPSARIESMFSLSKYVELLFPVGDDRKFVSALVVPNFDAFIEYFDANSISYDKSLLKFNEDGPVPVCVEVGDDFIGHEKVKELVDGDIQTANKVLEGFEQIKKYHIVKRKFTEETGEMTPTMKVKRKAVLANYKEAVEKLYS